MRAPVLPAWPRSQIASSDVIAIGSSGALPAMTPIDAPRPPARTIYPDRSPRSGKVGRTMASGRTRISARARLSNVAESSGTMSRATREPLGSGLQPRRGSNRLQCPMPDPTIEPVTPPRSTPTAAELTAPWAHALVTLDVGQIDPWTPIPNPRPSRPPTPPPIMAPRRELYARTHRLSTLTSLTMY